MVAPLPVLYLMRVFIVAVGIARRLVEVIHCNTTVKHVLLSSHAACQLLQKILMGSSRPALTLHRGLLLRVFCSCTYPVTLDANAATRLV
jgi:hypothetical protein